MDKDFDKRMMRRCLELAAGGLGRTSPNPLVGAVVVTPGGVIAGEGFHQAAGKAHAERVALMRAGRLAVGAALYVNLEPCAHTGRTPPCTDAVIAAGVKRVVAAMRDPNPLVAGRGICRLRKAGIQVEVGQLGREARRLNEIFIHNITTKTPFVALKLAQSLDGKIAVRPGVRTRISGPESLRRVHLLRSSHDAILVGVSTVAADDPLLNVRDFPEAAQPLRVVLDPTLRLPLSCRLVATAGSFPTLVIYDPNRTDEKRITTLRASGIELAGLECGSDGLFEVEKINGILSERGIASVLVEGGGRVASSYLSSGLVQRLHLFIAPLALGADALPGIGDEGSVRSLLRGMEREQLGPDIYLTGRLD